MKRISLCLTLLLGLCIPCYGRDAALKDGDVYIPEDYAHRPLNPDGNCVWCATQSVMTTAGYTWWDTIVSDARKKGWHGADMGDVLKVAETDGAEMDYQRGGGTDFLRRHIAKGLPCYVQGTGHAMVVVGIDEESVRMLDNGPILVDGWGRMKPMAEQSVPQVKAWSHEKFRRWWSGDSCCPKNPLPKPSPKPDPKPDPAPAPTPPKNEMAIDDLLKAIRQQIAEELAKNLPPPTPPEPAAPPKPPETKPATTDAPATSGAAWIVGIINTLGPLIAGLISLAGVKKT